MTKLLPTFFLALTLLGCSASRSGVEVKDAWSPPAPPGASVLAGYATVIAHDDDTLIGVTSPAAREVQLHTMSEENGVMRMRPVESIQLEAGETLRLEPGGMHLMLMDPDPARAADEPIELTFRFAKAGEIRTVAKVKPRD